MNILKAIPDKFSNIDTITLVKKLINYGKTLKWAIATLLESSL